MFYSHEVLTSRKYGVATVWLVATLGSKSNLKKVSRKAILDVDVRKACETIVTSEAPMALRLQSNLLYGVTRVYSHQCGYVLNDAETARNNIRAMFSAIRTAGLDQEGGHKGRSEQLVLQDDPNFLPGLDLVSIGMIELDLDKTTVESSRYSSLQSVRSRHADESQHAIGGIIIPSSDSQSLGCPGGFSDLLGAQRSPAAHGSEPMRFLEDDLGLIVDPDGTVHMGEAPLQQSHVLDEKTDHINQANPVAGDRLQSEHRDHYPAQYAVLPENYHDPGPLQDDFAFNPQSEAFEPASEPASRYHDTTSEGLQAAARLRKTRPLKTIPLDMHTELRNADLLRWSENYLDNMMGIMRHKDTLKLNLNAKKNAEHWVLGLTSPQSHVGPLDIFTGAKLLEAFTGIQLLQNGHKRARSEGEEINNGRRVRSRGESSPNEIARGLQDDDLPMVEDDSIEQGREAPTPIEDRHLSSILPWNLSAGSRHPTDAHPTSTSIAGAGPQLSLHGRRGSRFVSASPLLGRGVSGGDMEDLQLPGSDIGLTGEDEFQLFGPAAQVDTQTAGLSQWQREAIHGESANFLAFVQSAIEEADIAGAETTPEDDSLQGTVDFGTLLPPETNSHIVAAQAMLHVLALGTRNLLDVQQQQPFGMISLRIIPA